MATPPSAEAKQGNNHPSAADAAADPSVALSEWYDDTQYAQ